jgi:F-type H+-transporting ATPase subunit b
VLAALTVLAAETEAAVTEAKAKNPILPDGKEIIFALLFFVLLYLAMRFVLVPPLLRMRKEREDKVRADLDAAERAQAELGAVRADYEAALAGARSQADDIVEAARREAEAHRAQLQAGADAEIATLRQQAQGELGAARAQAITTLKGDVVGLAASAASAVVQTPLDAGAVRGVVDRTLN